MKIWSKTLTLADIRAACEEVNGDFPGCNVYMGSSTSWGGRGDQSLTLHEGPRTRRIDGVHLRSGRGRFHPNSGTHGADASGEMAASWTEWGWFLARVFARDPHARCGDYKGEADFNRQTNCKFVLAGTHRERQVKRYEAVAA